MSHVTLKLSHIITYSFKCHFVHLGVNEASIIHYWLCGVVRVIVYVLLNNISQI